METHLKVLSILYLVFAGLSVLFGLGILLLTGAVSGIVGTSGDTGFAIPFIRLGGTAVAVFCFVWSVPGFVVGFGLLGRQPWARILGIVMSALSLMHVPFGTALGVYGLWILFNRDTERLFAAHAST